MADQPCQGRAVILVHGYNVSNLERTVGKLRARFEFYGYRVETLNYGYLPHVWQITKHNPKVARRLVERVRYLTNLGYVVDVVAHSNGCTIGRIASEIYAMPVNTFVAINPALKKDLNPCASATLVQVWHNDGDRAVELGKWLRWLTPWASEARPWGEQGNEGYQGDDTNVINFDSNGDFLVYASGHSAVFKRPASKFFLQRIAQYCADMRIDLNPNMSER